MPVRNFITFTTIPGTSTRNFSNGTSQVVAGKMFGLGRARITNVTPNYWARKNSDSLSPLQLLFIRSDYTYGHGFTRYTTPTSWVDRNGYYDAWYAGDEMSAYGNPPPSRVDPLVQRATIGLYQKVKGMRINLAQAWAERQQVVDMIALTANRLATAYTQLRRGNVVGAVSSLGAPRKSSVERRYHRRRRQGSASGTAASDWLEFQYGWKPMLDDLYGAMQALVDHQFRLPYATATKTASAVYKESPSYFDGIYAKKTISYHETIKVKLGVRFKVVSSGIQELAALGITNPALLAWELLPYSFVVDWFLPIGDWVSTWDATLGTELQWAYLAHKYDQDVSMEILGLGQVSPTENYTGRVVGSGTRTVRDLSPLSNWPPVFFPSVKNPLSTTHMLNAISLLRVAFGR